MTRMIDLKEIHIFCDKDTNTALVRVYKYRNYVFAGGKTLEVLLCSDRFKELENMKKKYGEDQKDLWNTESEKAIVHKLDMSKEEKND